jgi:hypothetical protein
MTSGLQTHHHMRSLTMYHLHYMQQSPVVICFLEVIILAFAHSSISFNCCMSHQSESSTDAITRRYPSRHAATHTDRLIAEQIQIDEFNELDDDIDENSDFERELTANGEDESPALPASSEDEADGMSNDMEIVDEAAVDVDDSSNSSSTSSKNEAAARSRRGKQVREQWSTDVATIVLATRRFHRLDQPIDTASMTPFDVLSLILTDDVLSVWTAYTNAYHSNHRATELNLSANELLSFLAVLIYMGIVYLPRIDMYWDADHRQPFIIHMFSRSRFQSILSAFSVANPHEVDDNVQPSDYVAEFMSHLNDTFPSLYTPGQNLCIDEMMIAYKGRTDIRQYIPSKPHKWGYKFYALAESAYVLKLDLYTGASDAVTEHGSTHALVMRMMEGYENKSYNLFIDNWFSSPTLANHLHAQGIAVCGSVNLNRSGMPPSAQLNDRMFKKWVRGQYMHLQHGNNCLAVWKDSNVMKVLYNHIQPNTPVTSLKRWGASHARVDLPCPQAIHDYFYNARSVDVLGQLHYAYPIGRKAMNDLSSIVYGLIDICLVQAYTLFKLTHVDITQLDFRVQLYKELAAMHETEHDVVQTRAARDRNVALASDHYSELVKEDRDCKQCSHQPSHRKRTTYICHTCKVHLCLGQCFSLYHAKL